MFSDQEVISSQNCIVGLLQGIDIFGVGINIRFNQQSKHKTGFGGFITLVLTTLLLILFISSIQNIIQKSNPSVIYQEDFVSNPSRYNLTSENFSFAITLLDASFNPINDKSIFRIEGNFLYKEPQINSDGSVGEPVFKNKVIEFELCTEQSFQVQGTESYFLSLQYQSMYCFKNIDDYYLVGQFEKDEFSVIQINVIPCDQSDPNNQVQCMEESKKKQILSQSLLQVYYITRIVQVSSKSQPFKPMGITYFWENNIDFQQNISLMFMKTYVLDDDGLIFENNVQNNSLLFSSERTMLSSKKDFSIYQISLYLEKNKEKTYIRKYQKIFDCFSSIGGIYNVLFAIGCILVQPYSQIQLNRKLFNQTFKVSNSYQENQMNDSKSSNTSNKTDNNIESKNKTLKNQADLSYKSNKYKTQKLQKANIFFQNCQEEAEMQNQEQKKSIINMLKSKFIGIKIKSSEYLAYYFNCFKIFNNEKLEIINFGTKQILNYTDICFIVNKLIELEKLKALLLNEQQIYLFDFIPKPQIDISIIREIQQNQNERVSNIKLQNSIQQQQDKTQKIKNEIQSELNKQFNILSIQTKTTYEKAKDAQQAFNQIYRDKQKNSKIDLKLIQLLDQELVELFDGNAFQEKNLHTTLSFNQQISNVKQKHNPYYSPVYSRRDRLLSNKIPTQFSNVLNFNEELKNRKSNDEEFSQSEDVTETDTKLQTYYPRAKNFIQITNLRNLTIQKEIESSILQKKDIKNENF
ncbi:ubiquitin-conjugating enzyme family protein (macronuclear) [Tetrahymena thermophila SB210]|uniref:Ubiquitin-conjugating enzyme family protein n=1 Tax=Tetrahymena thermophila (strain SB210) TaxID=312017 RepID=W7X533_TETTS|nr:ubiquitin-conjugating enzyme family protein [Tetrahymena thermophila SB210]EWS71483.1 ubiquitin-conjugating enzyme family protein [Tetrahymena thermophila SB210]|eukprot:XP_012655986.1 ubiquitin-conjugating enzyme family protein [Tetrahymena thermophila SB210]